MKGLFAKISVHLRPDKISRIAQLFRGNAIYVAPSSMQVVTLMITTKVYLPIILRQ